MLFDGAGFVYIHTRRRGSSFAPQAANDLGHGQAQHGDKDGGAGERGERQHPGVVAVRDHDERVLQCEDGDQRVYEIDRPEKPDQAAGGSFSFSEVDGRHGDLICSIGRHGDRRDQCQGDGFLQPDHEGQRHDQADVQDQERQRGCQADAVSFALTVLTARQPFLKEDDRSAQGGEDEVVDADRAVPQGGMVYAEKAVVQREGCRHGQRAGGREDRFEIIIGFPAGEQQLSFVHGTSCPFRTA